MPRWLNIANTFTCVRLLLVPFIVRDILEGRHVRALVLFAIASATDLLDGASARHFGLSTQAGAYLDPIADKCLLSGVYLAFAAAGLVPWWLVAVIFGRDLSILVGVAAVMLLTPVRRFPPSVWGKLSTFVQMLTAVLWLGRNALEIQLLETLSSVMIWPCAAMTVWSGIHYTWRGVLVARAH
jgi:cardiolipin synthase